MQGMKLLELFPSSRDTRTETYDLPEPSHYLATVTTRIRHNGQMVSGDLFTFDFFGNDFLGSLHAASVTGLIPEIQAHGGEWELLKCEEVRIYRNQFIAPCPEPSCPNKFEFTVFVAYYPS